MTWPARLSLTNRAVVGRVAAVLRDQVLAHLPAGKRTSSSHRRRGRRSRDLDVELPPGGELTGTVRSELGTGVGDAVTTLSTPDGTVVAGPRGVAGPPGMS